jgi:hypothetical protein
MRRALGLLGARGTVAVALVVVVLALVGIGRLIGGSAPSGVVGSGDRTAVPTADPSDGDDSVVGATPTPPVNDTSVLAAAGDFTTAWLRRDLSASAWHAGLARLATEQLAESLRGVDPTGVPARRMTGSATVALRTEGFAQVAVPVDTGIVRLNLVQSGQRWLIDAIDWERT